MVTTYFIDIYDRFFQPRLMYTLSYHTEKEFNKVLKEVKPLYEKEDKFKIVSGSITIEDIIKEEKEFTVGLRERRKIVTYCIGSGNNIRDAKASAIKNVRNMLEKVRGMSEEVEIIGDACKI